MAKDCDVFVISDLHLGGAPGFRMMTEDAALGDFIGGLAARPAPVELVINGDFVDFLAEEHEGQRWRAFVEDDAVAADVFERVVGRYPGTFGSLRDFVGRGHRLVVLCGNHDLELTLPAVRSALSRRLGGADERTAIVHLFDGEAYAVGDALIEHGNQYDPANVVDHDGLRRARARLSRLQGARGVFEPPVGSRLVAEIINPLKTDYAFIDLLKPESEPLFAMLLALEPSSRKALGELALQLVRRSGRKLRRVVLDRGDLSAGIGSQDESEPTEEQSLHQVVADALGEAEKIGFVSALDSAGEQRATLPGDLAASRERAIAAFGLARLALTGSLASLEERLPMMQQALRAMSGDQTFDDAVESPRYLDAAERLVSAAGSRVRCVLFGHTHHAKDVKLGSGARYLNTGTWANLMRFPRALLDEDVTRARGALSGFLADVKNGRLASYLEFRPTFARLVVRNGRVLETELGQHR